MGKLTLILIAIFFVGCSMNISPDKDCSTADKKAMTEWIEWCSSKETGYPSFCIAEAKNIFCKRSCQEKDSANVH